VNHDPAFYIKFSCDSQEKQRSDTLNCGCLLFRRKDSGMDHLFFKMPRADEVDVYEGD